MEQINPYTGELQDYSKMSKWEYLLALHASRAVALALANGKVSDFPSLLRDTKEGYERRLQTVREFDSLIRLAALDLAFKHLWDKFIAAAKIVDIGCHFAQGKIEGEFRAKMKDIQSKITSGLDSITAQNLPLAEQYAHANTVMTEALNSMVELAEQIDRTSATESMTNTVMAILEKTGIGNALSDLAMTQAQQTEEIMKVKQDTDRLLERSAVIVPLLRRLGAEKREQTITQEQAASDFSVTTRTIKRWDNGQGSKWGYDSGMRTDPARRREYEKCVGMKQLYDKLRERAKSEGRVWRYTEVSFVESLHSIPTNMQDSASHVYDALMDSMNQ